MPRKIHTYGLYVANEDTGLRVNAMMPSRALQLAAQEYGVALKSQSGRYGKLVDGRNAAAFLVSAGTNGQPSIRTTRWPGVR